MEHVNKITIASVEAQPKKDSVKGEVQLMMVMGLVSAYSVGSTSYGDYLLFRGNFEAQNVETGKRYHSTKLILPGGSGDDLQLLVDNGEGSQIEFGFLISAKENKESNTGYVYSATPLVEGKETKAMDDLRGRIEKTLKSLPKPPEAANTNAKKKA